ncbi:CBU_0592 family membrane protein [Roseibium sp. SCP14]|uniref:CBU_0592 family membrane protein n=1 Tax=Roseibium sp. SCP14 TaxID=3141375 RepID=UPI00333B5E63
MPTDFGWLDVTGLLGSVIIIVAYYLATRGRLPADKLKFNVANLVGGALVMMSLIDRPNFAAILIECMFLLIAMAAIWRNLAAKGASQQ